MVDPAPLETTNRPANLRRGTFQYPGAISIHWFIYLRWVAVLGQLSTVLGVRYLFEIPLAMEPLLIAISVTMLSNLVLTGWYLGHRRTAVSREGSRLWANILAIVMAFDLLMLTCLLYYSGGPSNPFWIFYLVNLCLAGIELTALVAWCLNFLAVFCFAFLLYDHFPLEVGTLQNVLPGIRQSGMVTLAHNGVFCAFTTCASVIVFFSTLVTSRLRQRESELRELTAKRIRGEKLEALGTLAAGAAHELATPLGTIAVVVGELQRELQQKTDDPQVQEDVALIRSELDRCRAILNHMSAQAGEGSIEKKTTVTGQLLLDKILAGLPDQSRVRLQVNSDAAASEVVVEPYVTAQALRGMIKNALEASPANSEVNVSLQLRRNMLELAVTDQGEGMPDHVLTRVGEPFFTTKATGKGMGLGVFLARTVVERLGGAMQVESEQGEGTTVTCSIPSKPNSD